LPHYHAVPDVIEHAGVVYYVTDEYSAAPDVDAAAVSAMEQKILGQADIVFTVSDMLYEKKSKSNPNTILSPHGVDLEFFEKAASESTVIPGDIRDIPHPIAGFFGLIEDWIDLELIDYLAREHPDISFVLIGRAASDVDRLRDRVNIFLLGQKPYAQLPGYLRAFDVCLLPYKDHPQVVNSNPKKLREYLAGGKPVVSTPVREVEKYADFVHIAKNHSEYSAHIRRALDEDTPEKTTARIDAMRTESWEARVERISNIVDRKVYGTLDQP
jgi:glycosyltransferase involved in cell wall biosynthesis